MSDSSAINCQQTSADAIAGADGVRRRVAHFRPSLSIRCNIASSILFILAMLPSFAPSLAASKELEGVQDFIWSARAANAYEAQRAQERLHLTLFNTGRLELKRVVIEKGEFPGDVMRRAGAWVGTDTEASGALLCHLNQDHCQRARKPASAKEIADPTKHIAGFSITGKRNWLTRPGQVLVVPDLRITQISGLERSEEKSAGKSTEISREQVRRVPVCLDIKKSICVSDYVVPGQKDSAGSEGWLRKVSKMQGATQERSASQQRSFLLVPQLMAALHLPEAPFPHFTSQRAAKGYSFEDPGFTKLSSAIGPNLSSSIAVELKQTSALPTGEPNYVRQKSMFERFYNIAEYGPPPGFPAGIPLKIVIVDHLPRTEHCEFTNRPITKLAEPGVSSGAASITSPPPAPASAVPEADAALPPSCGVNESPWLPEYHGTHILGLIAAAQNQVGGAGLLSSIPNIRYFVIPIDVDKLRGNKVYARELANRLIEVFFDPGADIVNLSWNYFPTGGGDDALRDLIKTNSQILWVAAAGNEGEDANEICNSRPACFKFDNILGVAALESRNDVLQLLGGGNETNHGWTDFELGALGRDLFSTVGVNEYARASGSSQATAIVTAAAALLLSRKNLDPREVIDRLVYTSHILPNLKAAIRGGEVDVMVALDFDRDRIKLLTGCTYLGEAESLKFDNGADLVGGDFQIDGRDPASGDQQDTVNFSLNEARRVFFDEDDDSYIAFYERNNQLIRVAGRYGTRREARQIKFKIAEVRGTQCESAVGSTISITLDKMQDLTRRIR